MTVMSGLGIVLSLVFGCLLLALVAELYYLLWWKKQRSASMENDYSNHKKELLYLFCWDKPNKNRSINTTLANPSANLHDTTDIELGLGSSKDMLIKAFGEDNGIESELMRLHNLAGPPRFLFTIKEETNEDLESFDNNTSRKGSRSASLSDLIMALETQTPYISPLASPLKTTKLGINYNNPLFESCVEAEIYRLRSSPPPTFKFLRDAEEKMYRRLLEEAQKIAVLQEEEIDGKCKDDCLITKSEVHCSSQVLPLATD